MKVKDTNERTTMLSNLEKEKSSENSPSQKPLLSILLVEDNPGDAVIVTELLKLSDINFSLTHAKTLKETLSLCLENDFDIILLDLGLPDSVGLETLEKIHVSKIKSPVIVMTGLDDEDIALASLREGAQDYLVKNRLTSDTVLRTIKYGIERKKIQDIQKRHTHQFSILSGVATILNEYEDISSIFGIICEKISLLLEKASVTAIEFIDPTTIRMSATGWLKTKTDQIKLLTGFDLNRQVFSISDQKKNILDQFHDAKLHEIKGGIYEFLDGTVTLANCAELEKLLEINNVYVFALIQQNNIYGGFLIFTRKMIGDDDVKIIEAMGNQTSLSIHRRTIEKELRISELRYKELNKALEQKVIERTHDLNSVNHQMKKELIYRIQTQESLKKSESQLKELNATKDKFFNIIAHDLKNPFTSLLGSSELLFQNIHKMDNETIRELALILNDSAKSGYAILLNLLDWSRSQTGLLKFNPERINLSELIIENISSLQLLVANKEIGLHYEAEGDIYLFADKNMINTVLRNLLSNAVKFTHRSGKVIVRTNLTSDEAIISIKDSGIGISKDKIENLFRIDTNYSMPGTENEQGTGLGLKLSKELVEKQGGKIWVESILNKGSEFKFSIPIEKP
jgi:signal transduction histidine kinase/CheY-like chemotaxis protein